MKKGKYTLVALVLICFSSCLLSEPIKKHKKELGLIKDEANKSPSARFAEPGKATKIPTDKEGKDKKSSATKLKTANQKCEEKYSLETFMSIKSSHSPSSSRFGGLFFISDLKEAPQLFFIETPGKSPEQLTFFPDGIQYYKVSPDKEKILIATHVGGDEQYDIHLLNVKTRMIEPLIVGRSKRVESVYWEPKSTWFAFTSTERNKKDMDLYRYDITTKKQVLLTELVGQNTVTDISPDGSLIAITNFHSVTDSELLLFHTTAKAVKKIFSNQEPRYLETVRFSSDSQHFFFLSDEQHGITQLFQSSITNPQIKKLLSSGSWEVEYYELNDTRTELIFSTNEEGYSRLRSLEISSDGKTKKELSAPRFQKSVIKQISFSPAHGKGSFFFSETAANAVPAVWLWHHGKRTQWTQAIQSDINPLCFATEELIHYPSFDKKEIPAFIYLPKGVSFEVPRSIPFILFIHGGPESQYRPVFSKLFQYFLQRGFGIIAPNIRGSTGYGRDYTLSDNYKLRMDSIYDVVHAAQYLSKKGFAKSKSIALLGGSYGGFAVLRTIQVEPELFAAASESVGITNFITFLENTKPYRRALREVEYGPLSDKEFLKSISPMTYLDKIKTPLYIFHGSNDPRVPVSESEQIVKELQAREIPVELKIFPDEGHGNTKLKNILEQARLTAYFFEKHVKVEGNP